MGQFVYDSCEILFGGGLVEDMSSWMSSLYASLLTIIDGDNGVMQVALTIFSAIACSLLIIYFFWDLANQAGKDMFSFEKLIVSFIKLFVAFTVLLCLKDLVVGALKLGETLYNGLSTDSQLLAAISGDSTDIKYFGYDSMPEWSVVKRDFENEFKGITAFIKNFQVVLVCTLVFLIGFVAKIAGYFICTSNAVMIIARVVFCPVAVVQMFEDGTRSSGMKYLKGLIADCITMAVIIIVLFAASALTNGMLSNLAGITEITVSNLRHILTIENVAIVVIPELAAVGAMASGSKIAHDILGAHP